MKYYRLLLKIIFQLQPFDYAIINNRLLIEYEYIAKYANKITISFNDTYYVENFNKFSEKQQKNIIKLIKFFKEREEK